MEDVDGYVRPEFAEDVGEGISADGESVLFGDRAGSAGLRGIIRDRDGLSDAPAEDFRSIERVLSFIVGGDEDARSRIDGAFPETALAHRIVAFVLMENRWQDEDDPVVAVGPIEEAAPVVSSEAGNSLTEFGVLVGCLSLEGGEAGKQVSRIIEVILSGEPETFLWSRGGREGAGADGAKIGHDAEDALGLLRRLRRVLICRRRCLLGRIRRGLCGIV